jgi:hypothetical protein
VAAPVSSVALADPPVVRTPARDVAPQLLPAHAFTLTGSLAPAVPAVTPPAVEQRRATGLASAFVRSGRAIGSAFQKTGTRIARAF